MEAWKNGQEILAVISTTNVDKTAFHGNHLLSIDRHLLSIDRHLLSFLSRESVRTVDCLTVVKSVEKQGY